MIGKKQLASVLLIGALVVAGVSGYLIVKSNSKPKVTDVRDNCWFTNYGSNTKIESLKYAEGAQNAVSFHIPQTVKTVTGISCSSPDLIGGSLSNYVASTNPSYDSLSHIITITFTQNYVNSLDGGNQWFTLYLSAVVDKTNYSPLGSLTFISSETGDILTDPEIYSYISERTFSIAAVGSSYWVRGTGWLLNHTNTDVSSPATKYEYWLATNMHVTEGFRDTWNSQQGTIKYATSTTEIPNSNSYTSFNTSVIQSYEWYNSVAKTTIDMAIVKVNFGDATVSNQPGLKTRLDTLNAEYEENDHKLNTFWTGSISGLDNYLPPSKFIAGYPARATKTVWAKEKVAYSKVELTGHDINEQGTLSDISPGLKFYKNVSETQGWNYSKSIPWQDFTLSGGASGSMAVCHNPDSPYGVSICGIYWGGWINDPENPTIFWPCISCFNVTGSKIYSSYLS